MMEFEKERENKDPKETQQNRSAKQMRYTVAEKRDLIALSESKGQNTEKIARLKGVAATNIRRWKKELQKTPLDFGKDLRLGKSGRKIKHPELDEHLKEWFKKLRSAKAAVSIFMLNQEAKKFIDSKRITDIGLSRGWQQKLMDRLNIGKRKATHIAQKSSILFEPEIKKFVELITELRLYISFSFLKIIDLMDLIMLLI